MMNNLKRQNYVRREDLGLLMHVERRQTVGEHIPCLQRSISATNVPQLDLAIQAVNKLRYISAPLGMRHKVVSYLPVRNCSASVGCHLTF